MARKRLTDPPATDPGPSVSEQLRAAVGAHGDLYALAAAARVDPGFLYRFKKGQRGMSLETFDRLARALGLRLVQVKGPRSRPRAPRAGRSDLATRRSGAGPAAGSDLAEES